jgi:hypothetical protein
MDRPTVKPPMSPGHVGALVVLGSIGILVVLYALGRFLAPATGDAASQSYLISSAQQRVTSRLQDPESARFGKWAAAIDDDGRQVACGEVNAKNGFDGYTGATVWFSLTYRPSKRAVTCEYSTAPKGDCAVAQALQVMSVCIGNLAQIR